MNGGEIVNIIEFFDVGNVVYQKLMEPVCEKYDVTYMELMILLFLANNPTMDKARDIVEKRHIAKSHASTSIRSLMEKGYIEGKNLDGDRRSIHLTILPSAKKIVQAGQNAQKEYMKIVKEGLTKEELDSIKSCVEKIEINLMRKEKELKNGK